MTRQRDEDDDVIVDESEGAWEIRLGDELHGLRFTLEAALRRAREVAAVHRSRRVVMVDFSAGWAEVLSDADV